MNDHICQLMVNHLNLNNDKDFGFLLIKSIKNGSITEAIGKLKVFIDLHLINILDIHINEDSTIDIKYEYFE